MQRLKLLKRCPAVQEVPTVPKALQQTRQDDGTILAWMQLPPLKCIPRWFTWGLWAFVCLEDADGSRLCCGLPYPSVPSPGIPTERGSGHGAEAPAWQAGSAHSSAPTAAAWAPKPSIATNRSSSKRGHGGKASAQALPPRAASAKDLTGIRLELHQVSALSPQLQAGMSFTPPDSLFQVGTFNTRRGFATRDWGQQQPWSPFLGPLPILPSPFPSRPLFTLEPFPGVVVCPQETFHMALCGRSWERPPWFPNCFLSTPALSRCEFPPSICPLNCLGLLSLPSFSPKWAVSGSSA